MPHEIGKWSYMARSNRPGRWRLSSSLELLFSIPSRLTAMLPGFLRLLSIISRRRRYLQIGHKHFLPNQLPKNTSIILDAI